MTALKPTGILGWLRSIRTFAGANLSTGSRPAPIGPTEWMRATTTRNTSFAAIPCRNQGSGLGIWRTKKGGSSLPSPCRPACQCCIGGSTGIALQRLAAHDRRKSDIIELLSFGGLTYDETAAALESLPQP